MNTCANCYLPTNQAIYSDLRGKFLFCSNECVLQAVERNALYRSSLLYCIHTLPLFSSNSLLDSRLTPSPLREGASHLSIESSFQAYRYNSPSPSTIDGS